MKKKRIKPYRRNGQMVVAHTKTVRTGRKKAKRPIPALDHRKLAQHLGYAVGHAIGGVIRDHAESYLRHRLGIKW